MAPRRGTLARPGVGLAAAVLALALAHPARGDLECLSFGDNVYLSHAPGSCQAFVAKLNLLMTACKDEAIVVGCDNKNIDGQTVAIIKVNRRPHVCDHVPSTL